MKQNNRIVNWLIACGLALAMVTSVSAQTAKDRTGKVVKLKGAARYSVGNNVWQPLKLGDIVKSGTLIQTAAGSFVDLVLGGDGNLVAPRAGSPSSSGGVGYAPKAEQDVIRVKEDSVLALDRLSVIDTGTDQVTDTQLDLRSGKVFGSVKKLNATSRYEIKLPNGVAGIRGTVYQISAEGVVQVLTGSVVISWVAPDGTPRTETVNGGFQFDARTGQTTPLPQPIADQMTQDVSEGILVPAPPTTFIEDRTVYFVSPTQDVGN
jgi:hypothetical protein